MNLTSPPTESTQRASTSRVHLVRLGVACVIGILAALYVRAHAQAQPSFTSDFDQLWAAARAWLDGRNPYAEIGPGAAFAWKWPLYYPLPALIVAAPLAPLPVVWARMLFAGLSAGIFTFAISRHGWSRWPILLSITFFVSIDLVQWSLLLTASFFLPAIGIIAACKPNFGLPVILGRSRSRDAVRVLVGIALLLGVSILLRPSWIGEWMANVRSAPHFQAPIMRPFGWLLLAAIAKYRRPEARWLLALALIPQAPSFYDQLLLVAVTATWLETALLAAGTWALFFFVGAAGPQPDYAAWGTLVANATVWSCYLPCLVIVLRRPNQGEFPDLFARWRRPAESAPRPS